MPPVGSGYLVGMATVLVVYATTEGQTAKVAHYIADVARREGHEVEVVPAESLTGSEPSSIEPAEVVFVGGSLHAWHHQKALATFVRAHREELRHLRTGFFSVSMSAAEPDQAKSMKEAWQHIAEFEKQTGWHPSVSAPVAGALKYSQYGPIKRFVMRAIAKRHGGATDTSRDYEYTDWGRVTAFTERVLEGARANA